MGAASNFFVRIVRRILQTVFLEKPNLSVEESSLAVVAYEKNASTLNCSCCLFLSFVHVYMRFFYNYIDK